MKRIILLPVLLLVLTYGIQAQNIGINATGTSPDNSAMLDVSSTTKGMLVPRMTSAQRTVISSPAKGLLVFDTDNNSFWFYNGSVWVDLSSAGGAGNWSKNGVNIYNNNTGYVGIGTDNPLRPLSVKTPSNSFGFSQTDGTRTLSSYIGDASNGDAAFFGTETNNPLHFFTNNSAPLMTLTTTGNLGIGTRTPANKLTVQTLNNSYGISHLGEGGNMLATFMGGTSAGIGTFSNTNMRIFANGNSAIFINSENGNVGVGADFPANKFQIGSVGGTGYATGDLVIGNGTNAMAFYQSNYSTLLTSSTDLVLRPRNNGTGHIGINVDGPANQLQIGSVGATGFNGNDFAIGNGTHAMAIYQSDASTLIGSTTDIILKPRNNGTGRVGINTNTPRAPLEVSSDASVLNPNGVFYTHLHLGGEEVTGNSDFNPIPNISIFASGRVLASEVDVFSDERIKKLVSISNSGNDLKTLNALHITNYTMKDEVKFGNKQFKKVIAQQVEKVYPQVVSMHTDFIPNVYQLSQTITKTNEGLLLTFNTSHHISSNAKKLQLIIEGEGTKSFEIIAVPSATDVIIKATDLKGDKVFVYGEEVDDFRTVDYEGLTTLNISATQEISKQLKKQQEKINSLNQAMLLMANELRALKQPQNKLSNAQQKSSTNRIKKGKI